MTTLPREATQSAADDSPVELLARGQRQFIELWSQMAGNWGVPRSMAEVHALLFIAGRPMTADEIMAELGISRGGASMTLRTLVEWGIVSRDNCKSDRKVLYAAEQDVRTLFSTIICARKRREIEPLVVMLTQCRQTTQPQAAPEPKSPAAEALAQHNRKLDQMLDFVQAFDELTNRLLGGGGSGLGACMDALRDIK